MEAPARPDWYIRKLASATGALILRSQGLNFPSRPVRLISTMRPMVISVTASTHLATRKRVPTARPLIPNTFV